MAPRCLACGGPLDAPADGPMCGACWASIRPLAPPLCARCGDDLPTWALRPDSPALCPTCAARPPVIRLGRTAGHYEGALRLAIHGLKYEGRIGLAARLAALMRERGREALEGADLAVPVPLHWRRQQSRGFNQAHALARHLGLPVCGALARRRHTPSQVGLAAPARRRNLQAAFGATRRWLPLPARERDARRVEKAVVVLVDDVSTTGATLDACAGLLIRLGAREVRSLTAARAPASAR